MVVIHAVLATWKQINANVTVILPVEIQNNVSVVLHVNYLLVLQIQQTLKFAITMVNVKLKAKVQIELLCANVMQDTVVKSVKTLNVLLMQKVWNVVVPTVVHVQTVCVSVSLVGVVTHVINLVVKTQLVDIYAVLQHKVFAIRKKDNVSALLATVV